MNLKPVESELLAAKNAKADADEAATLAHTRAEKAGSAAAKASTDAAKAKVDHEEAQEEEALVKREADEVTFAYNKAVGERESTQAALDNAMATLSAVKEAAAKEMLVAQAAEKGANSGIAADEEERVADVKNLNVAVNAEAAKKKVLEDAMEAQKQGKKAGETAVAKAEEDAQETVDGLQKRVDEAQVEEQVTAPVLGETSGTKKQDLTTLKRLLNEARTEGDASIAAAKEEARLKLEELNAAVARAAQDAEAAEAQAKAAEGKAKASEGLSTLKLQEEQNALSESGEEKKSSREEVEEASKNKNQAEQKDLAAKKRLEIKAKAKQVTDEKLLVAQQKVGAARVQEAGLVPRAAAAATARSEANEEARNAEKAVLKAEDIMAAAVKKLERAKDKGQLKVSAAAKTEQERISHSKEALDEATKEYRAARADREEARKQSVVDRQAWRFRKMNYNFWGGEDDASNTIYKTDEYLHTKRDSSEGLVTCQGKLVLLNNGAIGQCAITTQVTCNAPPKKNTGHAFGAGDIEVETSFAIKSTTDREGNGPVAMSNTFSMQGRECYEERACSVVSLKTELDEEDKGYLSALYGVEDVRGACASVCAAA